MTTREDVDHEFGDPREDQGRSLPVARRIGSCPSCHQPILGRPTLTCPACGRPLDDSPRGRDGDASPFVDLRAEPERWCETRDYAVSSCVRCRAIMALDGLAELRNWRDLIRDCDVCRVLVFAAELAAVYGPDPREVGAADGTEDDFGDLICEAAAFAGVPDPLDDEERWARIQDAAANYDGPLMAGFVRAIADTEGAHA